MNFHRRQRPEFAGEFLGLERESFLGSLAADQLSGEARHCDGSFAAKRLERGLINYFSPVLLLEFNPHAEHLATICVSDCAHSIGVGQFPEVLRVAQSFSDALLQILLHKQFRLSMRRDTCASWGRLPGPTHPDRLAGT